MPSKFALRMTGLSHPKRLPGFQPSEQLLQGDAESISYADDRGKPKIFSPGFKVPDKSPVQFTIIGEFFLGFEAPLNADFPDTFS